MTAAADEAAEVVSAARLAVRGLDLWVGEPDDLVLLECSWKSAVLRARWRRPQRRDVVLKRCNPTSADVEASVYEEVLPLLSVPAPRLLGAWRDHDTTWLAIEDLGDELPVLEDVRQREMISRWLGELHAASRGLSDVPPLPDRSARHYVGLLGAAQARLVERQAEALAGDDEPALERAISGCDSLRLAWGAVERQAAVLPPVLVHADVAPENLRIVRSGGRLGVTAIDWEKAGIGTPFADLMFADPSAYARAAGAPVATVSSSMWVARLLGALSHNWASKPMAEVERYGGRIERALESICEL